MRWQTLARRATLAAAAIALSGCTDAFGPRDRLADARARWTRTRPANYRYRLSVSCFCPFTAAPITVEVHGDSVVSRTDAAGAPIDARVHASYPSIDGLFAVVSDAIGRGADQLDATYDPTRGFPTDVSIDYVRMAVDDEIVYRVDAFAALP